MRNLEELGYLKELGLLEKIVRDFSYIVLIMKARVFYENLKVKRTTVPLELKWQRTSPQAT